MWNWYTISSSPPYPMISLFYPSTPSSTPLSSIQILRGIAALLVVVWHSDLAIEAFTGDYWRDEGVPFRYVMVDALNPAITSAAQWFERTLDDSANKRLSIPEGFLLLTESLTSVLML